jgi:glycosyltransferase involved in cell wall biosynthesis
MPVYNGAAYLRESIQSILSQTLHDFELIIVNDGSQDSSAEIIENMRVLDSRIKVIHQENKGRVAARNAGMEAARGEFIACMDSDDVARSERFKVQFDYLMNHPDAVLVAGHVCLIDAKGNRGGVASGNRPGVTDLLHFPPTIITAFHPVCMMRSAAVKAIGGYRADYAHAEDHDFLIRIQQIGRLAHVEDILLDYRLHGKNVSFQIPTGQETDAARAELDNVQAARQRVGKRRLRLSADTFAAYVAIRMLRRELTELRSDGINRRAAYLKALGQILSGAATSEAYTTARLLLMLGFHGIRTIRAALA